MRRPYFKTVAGAPAPLTHTIARTVRFEEVDSMSIVWHGRYVGYFEEARVALGESLGFGYLDYYESGVMTPIKQLYVDHVLPLRFKDEFSVEAIMHWTEAARINIEFIIRNGQGQVAATGYSVQMMLDHDGEVMLGVPPFHQKLLDKWRGGEFS